MAVAALSPVKILSDLGYEVWEMENDADIRSALIESINTLSMINSSDPRIPVLQDAVKHIQKPKFKSKKVSVNKLMNRKVSSDQKLSPQKLLPAASEEGGEKDQTIVTSNLAERLDNIQNALKSLSQAFKQKLRLDKKVSEADVRNAKEADKLAREKKLETKKKKTFGGLGFKKLAQPAIAFFDILKRFFGNIFAGSILLGLLNWVKNKDNQDKIKEFSDFFSKHLGKILIGLGVLTGLALLSPILGLFKVLGWGAAILAWPLRRLGKMRLGGLGGGPKPKLRGPRSPLRGKVPITKGNWFTRGLNRINPLKSKGVGVTSGGNFFSRNWSKMFGGKGVTGVKPRGIKPGGIPVLGALLSLWDFGSRKAEGQTNVQAASGVGSGWLGALAATAMAGVLIPEPTTSIAGGITLAVLGTLGYNVGGMISDQMTGVNDDVKKAKISPSTTTAPPITSPTGTGNIQFLDLGGGGGQPSIVGGDGPGEGFQIPTFTSYDPNNLSTVTVRSIYGLVN